VAILLATRERFDEKHFPFAEQLQLSISNSMMPFIEEIGAAILVSHRRENLQQNQAA